MNKEHNESPNPKQSLLLIEDNPGDVGLFKAAISKTKLNDQYALECVESLQGAEEKLAQRNYALIICDLTLPDCEGLGNLEAFDKVQTWAPQSPILILSGSWHEAWAMEALQKGAQDYLDKNALTDPQQLWRSIYFAIERHAVDQKLTDKAEMLRSTNDNLQTMNHAYKIAQKQAETANQSKSTFLANMSHELRTPLNSLLILAQLMARNEEGNLTPQQVTFAKTIHKSGKDLLNIINDILDISNIETGKIEVNYEVLNLPELLEEFTPQFEILFHEKGLRWEVILKEDAHITFKSDIHKLTQILKNFISNALKFTSQGKVTLQIERCSPGTYFHNAKLQPETTLAFKVIDTGIGIPVEKQNTIFKPFQQIDASTSRQYGGTGLGLALCNELSQLLGGEILLESSPSTGSTFTLYLPLIEEGKTTAPSTVKSEINKLSNWLKEKPAKKSITNEQSERSPENTLLILSSNAVLCNALTTLAQNQNYSCIQCVSTEEGLEQAIEQTPSAIFLDLEIDKIQGPILLRQFKEERLTQNIPVYVLSDNEETRAQCVKDGAFGFIPKPLDTYEFSFLLFRHRSFKTGIRHRVLVIDGDPIATKALSTLIKTKTTMDSACTDSGAKAHKMLLEESFDCLILDLEFSDMKAITFLEEIAQDPAITVPPTVIYTFKDLSSDCRKILHKHAIAIFTKGIDSNQKLIHRITKSLTRTCNQKKNTEVESPKGFTVQSAHEDILSGKKLLVVDDDSRNTFALSMLLGKKGLKITIAENGQEALDKLTEENDFDLVLMDIMMPIMDGYQAIEEIRKQEHFKSLPIIALTAKTTPEERQRCLDLGANSFISRPLNLPKLLAKLEEALKGQAVKA